MAPVTARRRVVVCVGSPLLCNAQEPSASAPRDFELKWEGAVREAARANVAFYAFVPGRTAAWDDIGADVRGALIGVALVLILRIINKLWPTRT